MSTFTLLKKYLQSKALKASPEETFIAYLGTHSTQQDHEAFLEYIDTEYLANAKHRLTDRCAVKYGVFSLLDGMPTVTKGRTPSLEVVLDEQAYQGGTVPTYDFYLGDKRCKGHEQDFRQKLTFIRNIFDAPVDEDRAQAVAEYMMGPFKEESESEHDDDDEESLPEDEEETQPQLDQGNGKNVDMEEDISKDHQSDRHRTSHHEYDSAGDSASASESEGSDSSNGSVDSADSAGSDSEEDDRHNNHHRRHRYSEDGREKHKKSKYSHYKKSSAR